MFTFEHFEKVMQALVISLQFLYALFAFIMVRQVKLMNTSFTTYAARTFTFLARMHFFAALGMIVLTLILL